MKFLIVLLSVCAASYGGRVPRLDGRIVGGQQVDIKDFPYQVSVRIYDQHICGGSILDEKTVLTAAHCVDGMDHSKYTVRVGNTAHAQGTSVRVDQVRQNDDYNPNSINNDMAILKLAYPLNLGSTVQPVELQANGVEVSAGTVSWVSGWGVTSEGSETVPALLRAVDVAVISEPDCNEVYGGAVTDQMLCAQTINHDSCQGDSGGPLLANGRLIGVVSWGYGCARPQYPGVYAKVSNMYSWIQNNRS